MHTILHAQEHCKKYPQLNNHKCLSLAQKKETKNVQGGLNDYLFIFLNDFSFLTFKKPKTPLYCLKKNLN